jgi:hypothetical protein
LLTAYFRREIDHPDELYATFGKARLDLAERLARTSEGLVVRRYTDVDAEYLDVDFPSDGEGQPKCALLAFAEALGGAGLALPRFEADSEGETWLLSHLFGERVHFAELRGGGFASPRPIRRELRAYDVGEAGAPVADAALVERILAERGVRLASQGRDRKVQASDGDPTLFRVDLTEDEALDAVEEECYLEGLGHFSLEISP